MKALNLARKYASALFSSAKETKTEDQVYNELKVVRQGFDSEEISSFFANPMYTQTEKINAVEKLVEGLKVSEALKTFLLVLANKNRVQILPEITENFQSLIDSQNGVTRGEVTSSHMLTPQEREQIEDIVSKKTKKRVILTYKENPELLGGLIAKVDGYTFDDTLTMHLGRLNEDLRRRVH